MRTWIDRSLLLLTVVVATASMVLGGLPQGPAESAGQKQLNWYRAQKPAVSSAQDTDTDSADLKPAGVDLMELAILSGGEVDEVYATGWARVNQRNTPEEELKNIVIQAVKQVEPLMTETEGKTWPPGTWTTGSTGESRGVNYSRALGPGQRIEAWARSSSSAGESSGYGSEQGSGGMTYLVIQTTGLAAAPGTAPVRQAMETAFSQLGAEGRTSAGVVCWQEGKMEDSEMRRCIYQMLERAGAREVERLDQEGLISITAYTPEIIDGFDLGGKTVNLQVAARYHALDDRTYFHLGMPLIMTDY